MRNDVGRRDVRQDGSFIATVWFDLLFVPILPLASYRFIERDSVGVRLPGVFAFSHGSYTVYSEVATDRWHLARVYGTAFALILFVMFSADYAARRQPAKTPDDLIEPRELSTEARQTLEKALEGFSTPEMATPVGEYVERAQEAASRERSTFIGLLIVPQPHDRRIDGDSADWKWLKRGYCAYLCQSNDNCSAFRVDYRSGRSGCALLRSVSAVQPNEGASVGNTVFAFRKGTEPRPSDISRLVVTKVNGSGDVIGSKPTPGKYLTVEACQKALAGMAQAMKVQLPSASQSLRLSCRPGPD